MTNTDYTLEELVGMQDALEAFTEGVGFDAYIEMHKPRARHMAEHVWTLAQNEIWTHDTARRAGKAIRAAILANR